MSELLTKDINFDHSQNEVQYALGLDRVEYEDCELWMKRQVSRPKVASWSEAIEELLNDEKLSTAQKVFILWKY